MTISRIKRAIECAGIVALSISLIGQTAWAKGGGRGADKPEKVKVRKLKQNLNILGLGVNAVALRFLIDGLREGPYIVIVGEGPDIGASCEADLTGAIPTLVCGRSGISTGNSRVYVSDGLGFDTFDAFIPASSPPPDGVDTYRIDPSVFYVCSFLDSGALVVTVGIAVVGFEENDGSLTVIGAPVMMVGSVVGFDFVVSGSIPGDVTATYALMGAFTDADSWTGMFTITFGGTGGTNCSDQQFNMAGALIR